ncbi:MAG: alpha/beta fold hydrolase [Anaerolineales bacterium]|nr:alpha/beta fold hydrolase [Anaerolineales bacterium]
MHTDEPTPAARFYPRRPQPLRAALGAAILAAILGQLLAACAPARGGDVVPPGARPGDLSLKACAYKIQGTEFAADCGTLVVPENRADPGSRLIAVPVTRVRAQADQPAEPIFFLEGGPGQSNLGFEPPLGLLAGHDFVMVGYRGVDGTVRLDCPEYGQALKGIGGDLLSEASLARMGASAGECARRWQAAGVDLAGYTMPEVIADMELARAALGHPRIHLLSQSYGTRLAQLYAYLHPDRIVRSAMLAVNPPGRFVWEPETIDRQLQYFAGLCAQDAACRSRSPDLAETMRQVLANLPRRWLVVPIDPGKVKAMTFMGMTYRDMAVMTIDAYQAAAEGDPSGLALISLVWDFMAPSVLVWGDLLNKAGTADYDPARDYAADMNPPGSILGSPGSLAYFDSLGSWPITPIPAELRQVQPSDVETLVVNGSVDLYTPAEYTADELLPALSKGQEVIVAEAGHVQDLFGLQPAATERLLTSFYDTGVADASLFTYAPMDFSVRLGFPLMAKALAGAGLLLIAGLGAGLAWALRRLAHSRQTTGAPRPVAEGATAEAYPTHR